MIAIAHAHGLPRTSRPGDGIRVQIIHQMDPDGLIPGGIPTFIRGLMSSAPADIQISIVGLTTDHRLRPVGQWTLLERASREIPFFPVARDRDPGNRSFVPLSVKMAAGVLRHLRACSSDCDILEFHRFELLLPFLRDRRPKNVFIHQNMDVIRNAQSDIKWKHMPGLYFALERRLVPKCASVFCVRADAVAAYRESFPNIADRFRFTATWMDPELFHPVSDARRGELRQMFQRTLGLSPGEEVLASVGRLDQQKDPLLLVEAFARINAVRRNTRLIIVGDGVLRSAIVARIKALGLDASVVFAGLRSPQEVADLLQIADAFLLTSAYEGMPMSVLEALGCGVPVVTTKVGEVRRVVHSGLNGQVVDDRSPEAFARAALELLSRGDACRGTPCVEAVQEYVPQRVLAPVYENYRRLAGNGVHVDRASANNGESNDVP
jgi:glycosyltransferase involved in cell wall biosynthesis